MIEGLVLALLGICCFYCASEQWFLAMSDARFLFVFGEKKARAFNVLIGFVIFVNGIYLLMA